MGVAYKTPDIAGTPVVEVPDNSSSRVSRAGVIFDRGSLYTLALGTFAVGTEGFMIAAILPQVADSLRTSIEAAGQLVTIFALVYALSSPLLTALTASWPRRRLLMTSLAGFIFANLIAAAAPGFWWLAAARILLAVTAGLYVPNANAVASGLVPASHRGRALAIVNGGITVAVAVGVPLGALVGAHLGWRATFVGVAGLSAIAWLVLAARLPQEIAGGAAAGFRARLAVIALPGVLPILLTTTLWATGAYVVYTYVSPFLAQAAGQTSSDTGLVLTLLGVCAVGGVSLGGYASDRFGARRAQTVALPVSAAAFAALTVVALLWAPHALAPVLPLVALWGVSAWGFYPPQQSRLVECRRPPPHARGALPQRVLHVSGLLARSGARIGRHRADLGLLDRRCRRGLHALRDGGLRFRLAAWPDLTFTVAVGPSRVRQR